MKLPSHPSFVLFLVVLATALSAASIMQAQSSEQNDATPRAPSAEHLAWLKKAKTDYPLQTCLVSSEGLGGKMGGPVDYIYKQEGKPDRLVRLCCRSCLRDFSRSPERYLARLDAAEAAKAEHSDQPK